jgi:hypothetical protein
MAAGYLGVRGVTRRPVNKPSCLPDEGHADQAVASRPCWHEPDVRQLVRDPDLQGDYYLLHWVRETIQQGREHWQKVQAVAGHLLGHSPVLKEAEVAALIWLPPAGAKVETDPGCGGPVLRVRARGEARLRVLTLSLVGVTCSKALPLRPLSPGARARRRWVPQGRVPRRGDAGLVR